MKTLQFYQLHENVLNIIFSFLSLKDLQTLCLVSKSLHEQVSKSFVWKDFISKAYPFFKVFQHKFSEIWKQNFVLLQKQTQYLKELNGQFK